MRSPRDSHVRVIITRSCLTWEQDWPLAPIEWTIQPRPSRLQARARRRATKKKSPKADIAPCSPRTGEDGYYFVIRGHDPLVDGQCMMTPWQLDLSVGT